ncbi:hypothetical protein ACLQ3C_14820 [Gordonia sp. DT30]|uniref:hypothetical protein n=1 Tax=unclassified Gordonia (in: high G+C Gram-positive bacteria) TaxID=2657482 RepID=UPI003CF59E3A
MNTDENGRTDGGRASASGADRGGSAGDPLRELLLSLAGQIDVVAGWLGTGEQPAGAPSGAGTFLHETFLRDGLGADLVGDVTSLMREIGDLLARLIAAFITLLEAIAAALRTVPADAGPAPRRYQPISVRLSDDPRAPRAPGSDRPGMPSADAPRPRRSDHSAPEGEN